MKKPDLLILVAVWEFISAFFSVLAVFFMSAAFYLNASWFMGGMGAHMWEDVWGDWPMTGIFPSFVMVFSLLLFVAYFVLALLGGIGLLQGREWGRILSIIQAALSLLWFPIGTVIGILVLIYLVRTEVRDYFAAGGGKPPPAM